MEGEWEYEWPEVGLRDSEERKREQRSGIGEERATIDGGGERRDFD